MRNWLKIAFVFGGALASAALAGCTYVPGPRIACAVGEVGSAVTLSLTAADCQKLQAAFTTHQAAQHTAVDAEREEAVRKYRAAVAARVHADELRGYRTTSFDDFQFYGASLVRNHAKLAVRGVYLETRRGAFLVASRLDAAQIDKEGTPASGVPLVMKNASPSAKLLFARCQKDVVGKQLGCPMTVLGHAVACVRTTMFGRAQAPCLAVDEAWNIVPPS